MEVVFVDGKIENVTIKTVIKYFPTDGEYTDSRITLTDTLSLDINEEYSKAQNYEAPSSTGNVVGLSSAGKYIL